MLMPNVVYVAVEMVMPVAGHGVAGRGYHSAISMCAQLPANETSVCYIYLKQKMHLL
jgi:hypothetical protein